MVKKATKSRVKGKKAVAKKSVRVRNGSVQRTRKATSSSDLQHSLDTLLHTIRCIGQHEDELCTLLHDARRTGRISTALVRELRAVLRELPSEEYVDDLNAVQQVIAAA